MTELRAGDFGVGGKRRAARPRMEVADAPPVCAADEEEELRGGYADSLPNANVRFR